MIEELTFRGNYEVTATYFKNDMVINGSLTNSVGGESNYDYCDR